MTIGIDGTPRAGQGGNVAGYSNRAQLMRTRNAGAAPSDEAHKPPLRATWAPDTYIHAVTCVRECSAVGARDARRRVPVTGERCMPAGSPGTGNYIRAAWDYSIRNS